MVELGRDGDGRRRRIQKAVKGPREKAEEELHRLLREVETGTYFEPTKMTVAEYLRTWLESHKDHLRPKVAEDYRRLIETHIIPALGDLKLARLTPLHLERFYAQQRERGRLDGKGGLSKRTVSYEHAVLRKALRDAVRLRLLPNSPAAAVSVPAGRAPEKAVLTEEQADRLIRAVQQSPDGPLIITALGTGLRRGELLGLTWSDVDFAAHTLTVRRSVSWPRGGPVVGPPKSARSARTLPLARPVIEVLRQQRRRVAELRLAAGSAWKEHDLVFPGPTGRWQNPSAVWRRWAQLRSEAGLAGVRLHDLRHTWVTHMLRETDLATVSRMAGHSSAAFTADQYAHLLPAAARDAAEGLARRLLGDRP